MNWLVLVLIATIFDAIRIFIDNYTSDVYFKGKHAVALTLLSGYADIIVALILLPIINFNFQTANWSTIGLVLGAGTLSGISAIPYFKALEIEDSTNIGIFIQLAPIFYLIFGWLFFGETISITQLISFIIILSASFLIVFSTRKRSRHTKIRAALYVLIYIIIAVIGNLLFAKTTNNGLDFFESMAFLLIGKGIVHILTVWAVPKWHKRFYSVIKSSKGKALRPMLLNQGINIIKTFTYRAALVFAPAVALASVASDSTEPIVIFFMGIILTLIWPKFGREKLDKKTILVHLSATILVVIGVILIQF
ncbi:DMT family transporter [Candidatus Saccharibacteria bacterium]|nr:DMT family transporter [Candidatus Saccharibacteria bacterium]